MSPLGTRISLARTGLENRKKTAWPVERKSCFPNAAHVHSKFVILSIIILVGCFFCVKCAKGNEKEKKKTKGNANEDMQGI